MCDHVRLLRWWAVSTVFPDPLSIVDFPSVKDGDVVVAAVVVSFNVELLEFHFYNLKVRNKLFRYDKTTG